MKPKLTQAQSLLLHGLLTLVLGAAATALTTGYQALVSGQISTPMLTSFIFNSILIGIAKALFAYIPAHIPDELQAVKDTLQVQSEKQQQILDEFNNLTTVRAAVRPTGPQPLILKQPTAPTAPIPVFVPPARPATIQATSPDGPQQPFPVGQPPTPDAGG